MFIHALGIDLDTPAGRAMPHEIYARMRASHPVAAARHPYFGECHVLTRYDDVMLALRDPRFFSSRHSLDPASRKDRPWFVPRIIGLFDDSMACTDPPAHTRLRKLVSQAFTPRRVAALGERIEALTHELLDRMFAKLARTGEVDFIEAFALPLPLELMAELMGVPPAQRESFRVLLAQISTIDSGGMLGFVRQIPGSRRFIKLLESLIQLRRDEPGDDLLTALTHAHDEGDALSDEELLGMVFLLLFAGHETTVNLIANGILAFTQHPEQWERLRAEPERVPAAVEEILRYDNPAEHVAPRYLGEAVRFGERELGRGEIVIPVISAANRDPEVFEDPTRFDIGRDPKQHLGFGFGAHYCVGAPLARLEGKIAFSALAERVREMSLRAPLGELRWRPGTGVRGVLGLPMELRGG